MGFSGCNRAGAGVGKAIAARIKPTSTSGPIPAKIPTIAERLRRSIDARPRCGEKDAKTDDNCHKLGTDSADS